MFIHFCNTKDDFWDSCRKETCQAAPREPIVVFLFLNGFFFKLTFLEVADVPLGISIVSFFPHESQAAHQSVGGVMTSPLTLTVYKDLRRSPKRWKRKAFQAEMDKGVEEEDVAACWHRRVMITCKNEEFFKLKFFKGWSPMDRGKMMFFYFYLQAGIQDRKLSEQSTFGFLKFNFFVILNPVNICVLL